MKLTSPALAAQHFRSRIRFDIEEFWIATLNSDKFVTADQCLFRGTVNSCLFHPRDVFRFACVHNAAAFVVAHSHPSGSLAPSQEDVSVTEQLFTLSLILEVPMEDHLILTPTHHFSFFETGRLGATARTF